MRPSGGLIYLGQWEGTKDGLTRQQFEAWLAEAPVSQGESRFVENSGLFYVHHRGDLPGAGYWSHQYGPPDNSSCSQDDLIRGALGVLWWGRPGARPMQDSGNGNTATVAAGGRL